MATAETRAAVPAIKTKEAEVRDRATSLAVCLQDFLPEKKPTALEPTQEGGWGTRFD